MPLHQSFTESMLARCSVVGLARSEPGDAIIEDVQSFPSSTRREGSDANLAIPVATHLGVDERGELLKFWIQGRDCDWSFKLGWTGPLWCLPKSGRRPGR